MTLILLIEVIEPWNQVSSSLFSERKDFFWLSTNKNFVRLLSCTHQINSWLTHFICIQMHVYIYDLCPSFYTHFLPFSCLITFTYIPPKHSIIFFSLPVYLALYLSDFFLYMHTFISSMFTLEYHPSIIHLIIPNQYLIIFFIIFYRVISTT